MTRAFYHSAGDVMWSRTRLSDADVQALADIYWDSEIAARNAKDERAYAHASELGAQLLDAFQHALRWRQASGGIREIAA